jgi:hypothetical protein
LLFFLIWAALMYWVSREQAEGRRAVRRVELRSLFSALDVAALRKLIKGKGQVMKSKCSPCNLGNFFLSRVPCPVGTKGDLEFQVMVWGQLCLCVVCVCECVVFGGGGGSGALEGWGRSKKKQQ